MPFRFKINAFTQEVPFYYHWNSINLFILQFITMVLQSILSPDLNNPNWLEGVIVLGEPKQIE